MIPQFDNWFHGAEALGLRSERFYQDEKHGADMLRWLQSAWDAGYDASATRIATLESEILTLRADKAGDAAMIEALKAERDADRLTVEFHKSAVNAALERESQLLGQIENEALALKLCRRQANDRLTRIRSILSQMAEFMPDDEMVRQALAITYEGEQS